MFGTASLSADPPALRPQRLEEPGAFPQPHRKPVSAWNALSTRQILRLRLLLQAPTPKLRTCDLALGWDLGHPVSIPCGLQGERVSFCLSRG